MRWYDGFDLIDRRAGQSSYKTRNGEYILKNILIIDDDIHIGNMLEETLTKEGYGVFSAYSGT